MDAGFWKESGAVAGALDRNTDSMSLAEIRTIVRTLSAASLRPLAVRDILKWMNLFPESTTCCCLAMPGDLCRL
jgi:hypothetical protein